MRKIVLMMAVMATALVLGGGVALAATVNCDGGFCEGTQRNDTIRGSNGRDIVFAYAGNDRITAANGKDEVYGAQDDDLLRGGAGNDELYGGSSNDRVSGEDGVDEVNGGSGSDNLVGGRGVDQIYGGSGNDTVSADDGSAEIVDCGFGAEDRANIDETAGGADIDSVSNCEIVF